MGCGAGTLSKYSPFADDKPEGDAFYDDLRKDTDAAMKRVKEGKSMNLYLSGEGGYQGRSVLGQAMMTGELGQVRAIAATSSHDNGENLNAINVERQDQLTPLMWMATENKVPDETAIEIVNILADHGAKLDFQDERFGLGALHVATRHGRKPVLLALLQKRANIDLPDKQGYTALIMAARFEKLDIMRALVESGANLDLTNDEGDTALHEVARKGNTDCVRCLLDKKPRLVIQNKAGLTALYVAIYKGYQAVTIMLAESGARFELRHLSGRKALNEALGAFDESIMEKLVEQQPDIGTALLHGAAASGNVDLVKMLVKKGFDANAPDDSGETALHFAVKKHVMQTATFLVENGANLNAQNHEGDTALHLAIGNADIVRMLIKNRADIEVQNNLGQTPLLVGAHYLSMVSCLAENGANVNAQDQSGDTALHLAVRLARQTEILDILVKHGANLDVQNNGGETAVLIAAVNGWLQLVICLTGHGANLNVPNAKGETAFLLAVVHGMEDVVATWLEKAADLTPAEDLVKAFELATKENKWNIVAVLAERGVGIDFKSADMQPLLKSVVLGNHWEVVAALHDKVDWDWLDDAGRSILMQAILAAGDGASDRGGGPFCSVVRDLEFELRDATTSSRVGPFCIRLVDRDLNKWEVHCDFNYTILASVDNSHENATSSREVERGTAIVHKKKPGCRYYTVDDKDAYIVFHPGFENGGEEFSDIQVFGSGGWEHFRDVPEFGAIILKAKLPSDSDGDKAITSRVEAIRRLVEKGDNLDVQDKDGCTALMHAVGSEFASYASANAIIDRLIENFANVDLQNDKGETALMICESRCNVDCVKLLVEKGADVNLRDKDGSSALMRAGQHGEHLELGMPDTWRILSALAEKSIDLDFQDTDGCTLLMRACSFSSLRYWRCVSADFNPVRAHAKPDFSSETCYDIPWDAAFAVVEETVGADGVLYLFAPAYGWVCDTMPGVGAVCALDGNGTDAGINGFWSSEKRFQSHCGFLVQADYMASTVHKERGQVPEVHVFPRLSILTRTIFKFKGSDGYEIEAALSEDGKNMFVKDVGTLQREANIDGCWLRHGHQRHLIQGNFVQSFAADARLGSRILLRPGFDGFESCTAKLSEDGKLHFHWDKDSKRSSTAWVRDATVEEKMQKVTQLVDKGVNLDLQDQDGKTALMRAAHHRHVDVVAYLGKKRANLNLQDKKGRSALISATFSSAADVVQTLADLGADLDLQDEDGCTGLIYAVAHGSWDSARILAEKSANVDILSNKGESALMMAEAHNKVQLVHDFVRAGANLDVRAGTGGCTILMNCLTHKSLDIWNLLFGKAVDIGEENPLVLEKAANMNLDLTNAKGETVLILAVVQGNLNFTTDLVNNGANLDMQDANGCTALIHAASSCPNCSLEIASVLVEKAANLDVQSIKGKSALMHAACLPKENILTLLVTKGANLDLQDKHGNSAVMLAIRNKFLKHVNLLVTSNANMELVDDDGVSGRDLFDRLMKLSEKSGLEGCDEADDPNWCNFEIPAHWTNHLAPDTRKFDQMVYVETDVATKFNEVLHDTYKEIATRDRRCPKPEGSKCESTGGGCPCVQPGGDFFPTGYAVRRVIRIEDAVLWRRYAQKRALIKSKRAGEDFRKFDPPLLTDPFATRNADDIGSLEKDLNECWLWHGTHIRAALSIAQSNFAMSKAGSNVGTMYGKGVYLAESCTKADEYAKNEKDGFYNDVFAMILSRVCMGKMYYTTHRNPEAGEKTKDGSHDSTCGDRTVTAHTFREFVVYDADQVYPEYVVFFSRILKGDSEPVSTIPYQLQVPIYWKNCHKDPGHTPFDAYFPVRSSAKKLLQELVSRCSKEKLEVVQLLRYEDSKMLTDYDSQKEALKDSSIDIGKVDTIVDSALRDMGAEENDISTANLNLQINEMLLWHGTSKYAALSISADGFLITETAHGRRFGDGVYLAEDLDKSLSYARVEDDGIQYVLLCRAVCGDMFRTSAKWFEKAHKSAQAENKHSILAEPDGDPREFITLKTEQVYPEFLLHLRRIT